MTLTKRLYRLDEVRAAFLYSLKTRRIKESQFWLRELEESFYGTEARRMLFVAWFLLIGLRRVQWLYAWALDSGTTEGRAQLAWQLCRIEERDGSLWWILCAGALVGQGSWLIELWRGMCTADDETFWQPIVNKSEDERIDTILEAVQEDMRRFTPMARLVGLALTEVPLAETTWTALSASVPDGLEFEERELIRESREYEVPYLCLYGMSWRGMGADTTELLNSLALPELLQSAYWKRCLEPFVEGSTWKSDDALELFWDTYFPFDKSDIPDEWSKKDKQKSHGPGCTVQCGSPLWRWWKGWIPEGHRYCWGSPVEKVWTWVQGQQATVGATVLDRVLELYKELAPQNIPTRPQKTWILEAEEVCDTGEKGVAKTRGRK